MEKAENGISGGKKGEEIVEDKGGRGEEKTAVRVHWHVIYFLLL